MDIRLLETNFALFFMEPISRPDKLIPALNEKLDELFDLAPNILPFVDSTPAHFPYVLLNSSTKEYSCNISKVRIDLIYKPQNLVKDFLQVKEDVNQKVEGFVSAIQESEKVEGINRVGFVNTYFVRQENSAEFLKENFLKNYTEELREFTLRFNKKSQASNLEINDITLFDSSTFLIERKPVRGFIFQRDINNIAELGKNLTRMHIDELLGFAYNHFSPKEFEELISSERKKY